MIQNINYEGVKTDVQIIGFEMNDFINEKIEQLIRKVKKLAPSVNWVDMYFTYTQKQSTCLRKFRIRFAVPGPDLVAYDTGHNWKTILKNVEKKLIRQVIKRKTLTEK